MNELTIQAIDCRHKFLQSGKLWLYALRGGEVVGMLSLLIHGDEFAWINDLYVAESQRRNRVATKLVREAEYQAFQMEGVLGITAGVAADNHASRRLFASANFVHSYTSDYTGQLWVRRFTTKQKETE